ncbi:MAG: hypothetical protein Q8P22_05470 [Chloroflexota bacterium]|nr:hypothetical protein [Chloroflexota bacterium]
MRGLSIVLAIFGLVLVGGCTASAGDGAGVASPSPEATLDCTDPLNYAQCRTGDTGAAQDTVAPEGFLPGQVLANLPVYPGALGSAEVHVVGGPPSFPSEMSICRGPRCPGLQIASALFTVDATADEVFAWYQDKLTAMGYERHGGGFGYLADGRQKSTAVFISPDIPTLTVQVHLYYKPDLEYSPSLFELLVTYMAPLPRPVGSYLPPDVSRVDVTYAPGGDSPVLSNAVADPAVIRDLVRIVNRMPVRADWISWCSIDMGPPPTATLVFQSNEGATTVSDIRGCPFRVEMEPYPDLQDSYNRLWDAVERFMGVDTGVEGGESSENDAKLPSSIGPTPPPTPTPQG